MPFFISHILFIVSIKNWVSLLIEFINVQPNQKEYLFLILVGYLFI